MNAKVREKETYISQIVEERNEFKRTLDQYVIEIIILYYSLPLPLYDTYDINILTMNLKVRHHHSTS